jgi:acetyltransferase
MMDTSFMDVSTGLEPRRSSSPVMEEDTLRLADGTLITLRFARHEDGPIEQRLVRGLSARASYYRFFHVMRELTPEMLVRLTQNDPRRGATLLAVIRDASGESPVAMAEYVGSPWPERCEFAVVVADAWQQRGIGRWMIDRLTCLAKEAGFDRIEGELIGDNKAMHRLLVDLQFGMRHDPHNPELLLTSKRLAVESNCSQQRLRWETTRG